MTPEQLNLADNLIKRLLYAPDGHQTSMPLRCEAAAFLRALRATPDARVKEALDYIKMADNRLECEGCGRCVSVARSYLVEALAALSHQPGTGEADARNEPDLRNLRMASQIEAERLAHKRAPKSPALDTATVEADYTAWLIEINDSACDGPRYFQFTHDDDWTQDHNAAAHFSRKKDADRVIEHYGWTRAIASEHCWPKPVIREVIAESNGHHWIKAFNLTCCRDCGIVRRSDDKNKPCKGAVKIGPRALAAKEGA